MVDARKRSFGKYKIDKVIGRGASGTVFKASDPMMGRNVAIKLLHSADELYDEGAVNSRDRFLCEAKAYGRLRHPNIVSCYSCDEVESDLLLVMEYVDGVTLKDMFDRQEPIDRARAISIVLQILDALSYAHKKGVIHRDIKPSNIMIDAEGQVKITDFGIARLDTTDLTRTGMVLGSPGYMSPEQFMGRKVDTRTDIFSVAVIFYQLITGRLPFNGRDLGEILHKVLYEEPEVPCTINPSCPQALSEAIMKGLSKKAEKRFATASAFVDAIEEVSLAEEPRVTEGDITILDGQVIETKSPWWLNSGRVAALVSAAFVALVTIYLYTPDDGNEPDVLPQAKVSSSAFPVAEPLSGAIGGDEITQVAATKQTRLYSSINGLLSQVDCLEGQVKLHYSDVGYQVDMQGYFSDAEDLNLITSKVARLPGVISVNNQMRPGIAPYCDVVSFLKSSANNENMLVKPEGGLAMSFTEGERLTIGFSTLDRPLYYYVDYFLMDGSVVHLNATDSTSVVPLRPHQTFRIGGEKSSSQWEVTAPYGLEMVSVLATEKPLGEMLVSSVSSADYIADLKRRIEERDIDLVFSDYVYIYTQAK